MSTAAPTNTRPAAAPAAVIRRIEGAHESSTERLIKRHIPAWVVSGAVHVALVGVMLGLDVWMGPRAVAPASDAQLTVVTDDTPPPEKELDLTNPDLGLDSELPTAVANENLQEVNVDTAVVTPDPPGVEAATAAAPMDFIPPPGVGTPSLDPGALAGDAGGLAIGTGGGGSGMVANAGFNGRSAATKSKMVAQGGGNAASEAAVARGLVWLARQQKGSGAWVYDGAGSSHVTASTGMALLPFLAAGQTHKFSKDNKYQKNVEAGLKFLVAQQKRDGSFSQNMYAHAIATIAMCEALGMTGDRGFLSRPAQAAVNFIQGAQGADGSWGYGPNTNGDTSIVGWQIQALHSAKLCKELVVDKRTFERARGFLNKVASGPSQSQYGYRDPGASLTLTPVGLLCRYYMDGWGPQNPGLAAGVQYLLKNPPRDAYDNMYYYYYATQVVHFFEGIEWHQKWNPLMRDMLVKKQVGMDKGVSAGSWDPDKAITGEQTGRLGATCLSLLTLEVYYRHLPLYKRDAAGMKELERVK